MASGGTMVRSQKVDLPANAPKYLVDAARDIGTYEALKTKNGKRRSNPKVVEWIAQTTGQRLSAISTPWCAYWINAKLENAGWPSTKSGMARSYLKYGANIGKASEKWRVGDIGVIWRGSHNDGVTGHVFFIVSWTTSYVYGLGGNQGDSVSIQAFPRSKLLGVVRPRPLTASRTIQGAGGAVVNETVLKPAVDAVIPDAVPTPPVAPVQAPTIDVPAMPESSVIDSMINAADRSRSWVEALVPLKPWLMYVLSAITVALLLYSMWCRYRDWKEGFNS